MKKQSVLIVDDEQNVSKLISKVLARENYITYTAADGIEALEKIDSHEIDIVITDLRMPKMSGMELFQRIREIDPAVKVIIITAFATVDTAIEALRLGAKDYITKPFDIEAIVEAVKNLSHEETITETELLRHSPSELDNYIIAESPAMKEVMSLIHRVADSRASIILYGETGTGKELAAQAIHHLSGRATKPFIKVNCAAIPEQLLESELFGYEKGAFTGAVARKPGRFELADGGSIFLDEIGDMSKGTQVKLLRVLQEREFVHLGGTQTIKVDVRIIAATNRNLQDEVKNGHFREDLYYRLSVVPIFLPSLRERKEDIDLLIRHFLKRSAAISGRSAKMLSKEAQRRLREHIWPGNIRELENAIERCVVISSSDVIDVSDLPKSIATDPSGKTVPGNGNNLGIGIGGDTSAGGGNYNYKGDYADSGNTATSVKNSRAGAYLDHSVQDTASLDEAVDNAERDVIVRTLRDCGGNRTKASISLGISRRSLHRKLVKYEIED